MKRRIILLFCCITIASLSAFSQRFAVGDTNTIFKNQEGKILTAEEVQTLMKKTFSMRKENVNGKQIITILPQSNDAIDLRNAQIEAFKDKLRNTSISDFHFIDIDKKVLDLKELKGKVIVLNFWFTSCGPCIKEMPFLNELVVNNKENPVVFIAPAPENETQIRKFLKKNPFNYQIIPSALDYINTLKIENFPTHLIIDKEGIIRQVFIGYSDDIKIRLQEEINTLLK